MKSNQEKCAIDGPFIPRRPEDEFWIFHGDDLIGKPIYRLSHPDMSLGLTIHCTWMKDIHQKTYTEEQNQEERKKSYHQDYDHRLVTKSQKIQQLFREIIYPNFVNQTSEEEFIKSLRSQRSD
jgi:hypothetical protein